MDARLCDTGGGGRHINIHVVYGTPNQRTLNEAFWESVLCYTSGLGNSSQIILTDATFNFDTPNRMPMAALMALSDGWLVDADLVYSRLRGTKCASVFSKDGNTHTRTHRLRPDPGRLPATGHRSPQPWAPRSQCCLLSAGPDQPVQRVMKLRNLPLFSLPPREQEDTTAVIKILLKPHLSKWHAMIDTGAPIDDLWSLWTFIAQETRLALSCDDLNENRATPSPYAPQDLQRGHGAAAMIRHTTLGPTKTTRNGALRTRILSQVQSILGCLRPVIRWARKYAVRRKSQATVDFYKLGATPHSVSLDRRAACKRMRKLSTQICRDLELQDLQHWTPDPSLPVPRPIPKLVDIMSLHDDMRTLGKVYARQEERARIRKWKDKMNASWLDKPKEVYAWIQQEYQPSLVMLEDSDTSTERMDSILHNAWDVIMRKYADKPEPDVQTFTNTYGHFFVKTRQMQSAPLTDPRIRKRLKKMGIHTATGLDGWCVSDLLCLADEVLDMFAELLGIVEDMGIWPAALARGFISLIPKGATHATTPQSQFFPGCTEYG